MPPSKLDVRIGVDADIIVYVENEYYLKAVEEAIKKGQQTPKSRKSVYNNALREWMNAKKAGKI